MRPMRETVRQTKIKRVLADGEKEFRQKLTSLFKQRFNALKRELRRGNLYKHLLKDSNYVKGLSWAGWIGQVTTTLQDIAYRIVSNIAAIENAFWQSRDKPYTPPDPPTVVQDYEQRVGRSFTDIATEIQSDTVETVATWHAQPERDFKMLTDRLESLYSEARADAIAVTESAALSSQVGIDSMQQQGLFQWNFVLAPEMNGYPCQQCVDYAAANPHRISDPFPPLHPHDRCTYAYIGA